MFKAVKTGIIYGLAWVLCTTLGIVTLEFVKPAKIDATGKTLKVWYFDGNDKLVKLTVTNKIIWIKYPYDALRVREVKP